MIGDAGRPNEAKGTPSRSDTMMLIRANPKSKTISLISFRATSAPRRSARAIDLRDEDQRGVRGLWLARTLDARNLTGSLVNHLITVNFRGFTQVVDRLDGLDVDRRYAQQQRPPLTSVQTFSRAIRS